jgi:two-component system response regulator HydG
MHDPRQPDAQFQGRDLPREGERQTAALGNVNLGDLCLAVGNLADALAYYRKALTPESQANGETRLAVVLKISACLRRQGKADEALGLVESVIPSLEGRRRRDLLAEQATLLCLLGRYGEAYAVCEEARRDEPADERGKDAGVYLVLGHVLSRLCKWKQAIVCLEQAATFARMSGDQAALGNALNNLGIVYKNMCRFGDSARFLNRAVAVARRTGDDASLAVRLLNLATTLLKSGEIDAAGGAVEECARISSLLNLERTAALASICRARLEKARGNLAEAGRLLEAVLGAAALDEPRVVQLAQETRGEILGEAGNLAEARRTLEACLGEVKGGAKDIEAEVGSRLAEVWLALGTPARARCYAREAMAVARGIGDLYEVGRCLRVLAMCDPGSSRGRACLERAEEIFLRIGARLEYGLTLAARASLAVSPSQSALQALERAADVLGACGAARARVTALSGAAAMSADLGRHEKALTLLQQAETAGSGSGDTRALVAARATVDRRLAGQLSARRDTGQASPQEAFDYMRARLGVACLVMGSAPDGASPEVLSAYGADSETAAMLVGLASRIEGRALVLSGLKDTAPALAARSRLESVLGVATGEGRSRLVCILGWRADRRPDAAGSRASRLVEAYHEVVGLRASPAGTQDSRVSPIPVCLGGLLTQDEAFKATLLSLVKVARTKASVLIVGETGTGKDVAARAIHDLSPRRGRPFVPQNCAALPEHLLESELFGHRAGAFTDARADKRGLLEEAAGGTFFLDEIGDVSPAIQAKMLRAIESGEIRRLGETHTRSIDVRFVSATNKRLEEEIDRGRFRRDLYYRLNVVSLSLPPLRERKQDIPLLARLFLGRFARAAGRGSIDIDEGATRALVAHPWPGNVRQLENEIERAVAILSPGGVLTSDTLSADLAGGRRGPATFSLKDEIRAVERSRIVAALEKCGWNKTHAARMLGDVSRPALVAKMKRLGIALSRPTG